MLRNSESITQFMKNYPLTSGIFVLNVLLFIFETFSGGTKNIDTQLQHGAFYEPLVLQGEWYRFVTAMFLHGGFEHLLFNMFSLLVFVAPLEKMLGKVKYLLLYFGSGIAGNLAVLLFTENTVVVGASGAIYGMVGVFLTLIIKNRHHVDKQFKQSFFAMLGINLLFTFVFSNISVEGHLGGLFFGFALSMLIVKNIYRY